MPTLRDVMMAAVNALRVLLCWVGLHDLHDPRRVSARAMRLMCRRCRRDFAAYRRSEGWWQLVPWDAELAGLYNLLRGEDS